METKPKTEFRRVSKPLDEKQTAELGNKLADLIAERDSKEDQKKAYDKVIGDEIKSLDTQCSQLSRQIKSGTTDIDVECTVEYDTPEHNKKIYYSYPDGEIISVDDMTQEEIERLAAPLFNQEEREHVKNDHICRNCVNSVYSHEFEDGTKYDCDEPVSDYYGEEMSALDTCEHCTFSRAKMLFGFDPDSFEDLKGKWFINDGSFSLTEKMLELTGSNEYNAAVADAVIENAEKVADHLIIFGEYKRMTKLFSYVTEPHLVLKLDKKQSFYAFPTLPVEEEELFETRTNVSPEDLDEPTEESALHIPENVEEEEKF